MALGRVAGASEEARGRTDDDAGFRNNHERGIFFLFQNQLGSRDDDEQSRVASILRKKLECDNFGGS